MVSGFGGECLLGVSQPTMWTSQKNKNQRVGSEDPVEVLQEPLAACRNAEDVYLQDSRQNRGVQPPRGKIVLFSCLVLFPHIF